MHWLTVSRLALLGLLTLLLVSQAVAATPQAVSGTLTLDRTWVTSPGGTVKITLVDADLNVGETQTNEPSDFDGTPYVFPFTAGNDAGVSQQVRVQKFPILDNNGDGIVNFMDVVVSYADLEILQVDALNGLVTVRAKTGEATAVPTPYTLTYKGAVVNLTPAVVGPGAVKVTSSQDVVGFVIVLKETGAATGIFEATFKADSFTDLTGADDPFNATRPKILASHGTVITVSYIDASPPSTKSALVLVDAMGPTFTDLQPPDGSLVPGTTALFSAIISDPDSGVDVIGTPPEVVLTSGPMTGSFPAQSISNVPGGVAASVVLILPYGAYSWRWLAHDTAGNPGLSQVGSPPHDLQFIAVPALSVTGMITAKDTDGAAGVALAIPEVYDANTGNPLPGTLIGAYQAALTYVGALLRVLDVRQKAPLGAGGETIDNPGGNVAFDGSAPGGAPWPLDPLAFVPLRLTGCTTDSMTLTPLFNQILDPNGVAMQISQPPAKTYRRGDAKANGVVDMGDALFGAQYVAGLRSIGEGLDKVNAVNIASVRHDNGFDLITTADVLYIAQRAVGQRDNCFQLLLAPTPTPTPTSTPVPSTPTPTPTPTPVPPTPTPTLTPTPVPPTPTAVIPVHSHIANFTHQSWTLPIDTTIIWHNHDAAPHTSTSGVSPNPDGLWDSGILSQGQTFAPTFTQAGVFPYFCAVHPSMTGTVTITP